MRRNLARPEALARIPAPTRRALAAGLVLVLATITFGAAAMITDGTQTPQQDAATTDAAQIPHGSSSSSLDALLSPRGFDPFEGPDLSHEAPFALETGTLPTRSQALDFPNQYQRFLARGDDGLKTLKSQGAIRGAGTIDDPYVLEDFYIKDDLTVESTDKAIILRNGYVGGQLSINYVGSDVYVHHVRAHDLRINENIQRSGTNTGGLWHDNHFDFVGQIRHFTGEFRDNVVGPKPAGLTTTFLSDTGAQNLPAAVVFNFDGFHAADVHHNTFHGMVDIKLHGHNHGDCFVCPIHDHALDGDTPEAHAESGHLDDDAPLGFRSRHSVRYHSLMFRDNTIDVPSGSALRYNDRAHAGDDRTANSEPNEYLEDPHGHWQDITFARNMLTGGGFSLEIFNAQDDLHLASHQGILRIVDNDISISWTDARIIGMVLARADGLELFVADNTITFDDGRNDGTESMLTKRLTRTPDRIGVHLDRIERANLTLAGNTVTGASHGIHSTNILDDVYWELLGNHIEADNQTTGDGSAPQPHESDDPRATQRKEDA